MASEACQLASSISPRPSLATYSIREEGDALIAVIHTISENGCDGNGAELNGAAREEQESFLSVADFSASEESNEIDSSKYVSSDEEIDKKPETDQLPIKEDTHQGPLGVVDFSSDDFRIYHFKVDLCPYDANDGHEWTECPYAHPGEKAKRRDPRLYAYSCSACPDFRKGACKRGDLCPFSHGVFECWCHPNRYRTQLCKDATACNRPTCFFAHTLAELRSPPPGLGLGGALSDIDSEPIWPSSLLYPAAALLNSVGVESPLMQPAAPRAVHPPPPIHGLLAESTLHAGALLDLLEILKLSNEAPMHHQQISPMLPQPLAHPVGGGGFVPGLGLLPTNPLHQFHPPAYPSLPRLNPTNGFPHSVSAGDLPLANMNASQPLAAPPFNPLLSHLLAQQQQQQQLQALAALAAINAANNPLAPPLGSSVRPAHTSAHQIRPWSAGIPNVNANVNAIGNILLNNQHMSALLNTDGLNNMPPQQGMQIRPSPGINAYQHMNSAGSAWEF